MNPENLRRWAERERSVQEEMGELQTSVPPGELLIHILVMLFNIGFLVAACVVMYLIGRAIVG